MSQKASSKQERRMWFTAEQTGQLSRSVENCRVMYENCEWSLRLHYEIWIGGLAWLDHMWSIGSGLKFHTFFKKGLDKLELFSWRITEGNLLIESAPPGFIFFVTKAQLDTSDRIWLPTMLKVMQTVNIMPPPPFFWIGLISGFVRESQDYRGFKSWHWGLSSPQRWVWHWLSAGCTAYASWLSLFFLVWPPWKSDHLLSQHGPGNNSQASMVMIIYILLIICLIRLFKVLWVPLSTWRLKIFSSYGTILLKIYHI